MFMFVMNFGSSSDNGLESRTEKRNTKMMLRLFSRVWKKISVVISLMAFSFLRSGRKHPTLGFFEKQYGVISLKKQHVEEPCQLWNWIIALHLNEATWAHL